jgi:hypothetical protein
MEQGFLLAKELNQPWAEVQEMTGAERRWLMDRLIQWYKDKADAMEKDLGETSSGRSKLLEMTDGV